MNIKNLSMIAFMASLADVTSVQDYGMPKFKSSIGKKIDVRTEPKIGRNQVCPKCDSGNKYKKCCGASV